MRVRNHKGRFMSPKVMDDRVRTLHAVGGFILSYVHRDDAKRFGYVHYSDLRGEYSNGHRWLTVTGEGSEHYGEPYVSFDGIALDEDSYGQASSVVRSNFRSLMRDFPDFPWVNTSLLNTNALGCFVADLDDDMAERLIGLAEGYPVYDEGDMSELESDEITESWSSYMSSEIWRVLSEPLRVMWDAIGEDEITDMWWACVSGDVFGSYPEHHGVEVTWGDVQSRARDFRPFIIHAYMSIREGGSLPAAWDWVPLVAKFRDRYREGREAELTRLYRAFVDDATIMHHDGAWHRYLTDRGWINTEHGYVREGTNR